MAEKPLVRLIKMPLSIYVKSRRINYSEVNLEATAHTAANLAHVARSVTLNAGDSRGV